MVVSVIDDKKGRRRPVPPRSKLGAYTFVAVAAGGLLMQRRNVSETDPSTRRPSRWGRRVRRVAVYSVDPVTRP
jgi:hypothetical protein